MSVQSEIDRIITAVGNAYSKVSEKGGTVPASQTVANLATAIGSIPAGGGEPSLQSKSVTYTTNGANTITPDAGYDGLSSVGVTVNVAGSGGGVIKHLDITQDFFPFVANDVTFEYCYFPGCNEVEIDPTSTNLSFNYCSFNNITITCTQSIRDAIENGVDNNLHSVQFNIIE